MVIIAGHLTIKENKRDEFLEKSKEAILIARKNSQCFAFNVTPDLIEPDRVCIFERWKNKEALKNFRGNGPGEDLSSLIVGAEIGEYLVG